MSSSVEQIKSRLSIQQVVGSYLKLEKAGINYKAKCPFHNEKTASFFVSPSRDSFHCFGCNKGGDIFTFVEEIEGIEFPDALRLLADRAGVSLPEYRPGEESSRAKVRKVLEAATRFYEEKFLASGVASKYIYDRGVTKESREIFHIGFAPAGWDNLLRHLKPLGFKDQDLSQSGLFISGERGLYDRFRNRIMFPIYDYGAAIVGFTGRVIPPADEKEAKYVNTPETALYHKSKVIYGLNLAKQAIREKGEVILVEGQMDVIMSHQAGVQNVVAVSGTAFTEDHLKILERLTDNLILVLDTDEAGFRATAKTAQTIFTGGLDVSVVLVEGAKDPAELILKDPKLWQAAVVKKQNFIDYAFSLLGREIRERKEKEKLVREHIYPYIAVIIQPLRRDEALSKVANFLNSSTDAVRDDFSSWQKKNNFSREPFAGRPAGAREEKSSRKEQIIRRLFGIVFWEEKKGEDKAAGDLKNKLEEILGKDASGFSESDKERLVFEAEAYYNGKTIALETENLLRHLRREVLTEKLETLLGELRAAELSKDTETVSNLLKACQEVSREINLLNIA